MIDGNEQIFPLVFGVGDTECSELWEFCFVKLKEAIEDMDGLMIISNRHNRILNAIQKVYPTAEHSFFMYHVLGNLKTKFKRLSKEVNWKFYGAAKVYTNAEWEKFMQMLDEEHRGIRIYLETEIGNQKWSIYFFNGTWYSIRTSNNAESLNVTDKKPKEFLISKLIDWFRERMQELFYTTQRKAAGTFFPLSIEAQKRLDVSHGHSSGLTVRPSSVYEFEVEARDGERCVVNLEEKTYSYMEFQIDQITFSHAITAYRVRGFSVYDYVSKYYKKEN